jgi:hypothetical protein
MENMGAVKVNDILSHSGVKGMKWGVTAAKSTTNSKARVAKKVSNGYTPKNAVRGNRAKRWAGTLAGTNVANTAVSHVLLATGAVKISALGVITAGLGPAIAGTVGATVVGGVVGNRIMRKYGKRRLNEVRAEQAKANKP